MGTANSDTPTTQMTATQSQGSIVEPRPLGIESHHTDEMFLSPRVLDGGAFSRYSEMLKSIITQASTQGRTLEDFSTDAEAMIKRCDVTSEAINKRMQAGVRMLKMIDERADRTEKILDTVQMKLPDPDALSAQIDMIIKKKLLESQRQIDEIVTQAQIRVEAAEKRAQEAIDKSQGHASKLAQLAARIDTQLNELDARIENTRNQTSESLSDLITQTNEAREEIGTSIDQVLARAQESGAHLAAKIDEASILTDARIAELNKSIEPVLEASHQAMRTLGMDPENPVFEDSPLARIEQLVERGETQMASLDRVYRQLEDLQSQAQGVKAVFGVWLVDAAEELDVLEARKDTIVGPMAKAAGIIADLGPDLEDKLELASTQLTHLQIEQQTLRQTIQASSSVANEVSKRMTNESGQLQALLDGSVHKLSTRVEQAGVWLGALIQRAETLGGTLPGAGRMEFGDATPAESTPIQSAPAIPKPAPVPAAVPTPVPAPAPVQPSAPPVSAYAVPSAPIRALQNQTATPNIQTQSKPTPIQPTPIQPAPVAEPRKPLVSPQPPCLPIDAMSFDGSVMVIEHKRD